jgi:diguanylate cyclase (GGDEF)-like protein
MSWLRRLRSWYAGIGTSWLLLVVGVLALGGLGVFSVLGLQARSHAQAVSAATQDARVIARLTAARDVHSDDVTNPLSTAERDDLRGDVEQLVGGDYLMGLTVRRRNGTVLFAQGVPVPASVSIRLSVQVSFFSAPAADGRHRDAVAVVLPLDVTQDGSPDFLIGITIPAQPVVDSSSWASGWLTAVIILLLLIAVGGMVGMRRRLLRREYQARHDPLTGLGNRLLLETMAGDLLSHGDSSSILLMNLDGFKRVNDALGHAAGDELLIQVADALRGQIRPGDLLLRLGGDEFGVLMPGVDDASVHPLAVRLLAGVQTQFEICGVLVDNDASVGAAVSPRDGDSVGELLRIAEIAMYEAKRGKLGVCTEAQARSEIGTHDLQLLIELRTAISSGQLRLHYQPAVALQPGVQDFVEALVRWQHPTRGLVPPDVFIPLAEDTALIHGLTAWVLNEAVRQCAAWRLDGLDVRVAVNISPRSLTYHGLVDLVTETLARHQLPAEALHLEVTESAVISRPEIARDILSQLRQRGITTLIDDFGTGFTSLAHLKTMPIDLLKIDRGFVQHMCTEPSDDTVVRSVIELAHGLGMHVVAEGVEDGETQQRLTDHGCDIAQGFHLSRPLPAADATSWLYRHRAPAASAISSPSLPQHGGDVGPDGERRSGGW